MRSNTLPCWGSLLLFAALCGCGTNQEQTLQSSETTEANAMAPADSAANPAVDKKDAVSGKNVVSNENMTSVENALDGESAATSEMVKPAIVPEAGTAEPTETSNPVETPEATSWVQPETTSVAGKPVVKKLTVPTNTATAETTRRMETPQLAVTAFLNAIREGNNAIVEDMLSNRARKNVTEMGLVVTPPADPSMDFTLGEVEMLGETGASVTCEVCCDVETDGQTIRQTVPYHWVLRQEPVRGWRIAGATMKIQSDEPPVMFDFENLEETLRKIAAIEQSMTR
ncbi:MAG: hypothetical protein PHE53_00470 [Thermoguttaceae bacterium]|nr:hypothetical protein [Thermoguttaceae bacterium]